MDCPFDASCSESSYGNLTVSTSDPAKVIYCHSCRVRGNLLTLIHGLETNTAPAGGKLRGDEFKLAVHVLKEINGSSPVDTNPTRVPQPTIETKQSPTNIPLSKSPNEKAREIADLYMDLETDVGKMPPDAASYFRSRPWLTPELCERWGVGYLPKDGRSMFRSWIVYTHRNQKNEVITYSGRDPGFERKWNRWLRDGKPETRKPMKHKYVKGFSRGNELYGQPATRLQYHELQESLNEYGLFVVEGMNDVIKLDSMGIAAVGICGNRATECQVDRIASFAQQVAKNRVVLLPDCDDEGEAGFQDLLWRLAERNVQTQLGWSQNCLPEDSNLQPEGIELHHWDWLVGRLKSAGA